MLLSEAEKDSGVIPGPVPRKIRYDRDQAARARYAARWRRQNLGADTYVPLDQQGFSFADNSISQPVASFMTQIPSVQASIQPYQIQATLPDFQFDPSTIQMPTLPDLPAPDAGATYQSSWTQPNYAPPLPDFVSPSIPDIQMPSFTVADQKPANPAPSGSDTDWLTKALQIATVGAQTYTAVNAANNARPYYTPGTTPSMYAGGSPQPIYPGVSYPGISPGVPIGTQQLTAAQLAQLTAPQRVQYAQMYPSAPGGYDTAGAGGGTDFVSSLFAGADTKSLLLWGGAGLLLTMLLMRRPQSA